MACCALHQVQQRRRAAGGGRKQIINISTPPTSPNRGCWSTRSCDYRSVISEALAPTEGACERGADRRSGASLTDLDAAFRFSCSTTDLQQVVVTSSNSNSHLSLHPPLLPSFPWPLASSDITDQSEKERFQQPNDFSEESILPQRSSPPEARLLPGIQREHKKQASERKALWEFSCNEDTCRYP